MKKHILAFILAVAVGFGPPLWAATTVIPTGGSGSGWSKVTDCSTTTTDGTGCYNTSTKALCIGNGTTCVLQPALSINPRGAYAGGTQYFLGDSVSYTNGNSYVALTTTTGNIPTNTSYWQLLASKGTTGAAGADGATGAQGAQGPAGTGNMNGPGPTVVDGGTVCWNGTGGYTTKDCSTANDNSREMQVQKNTATCPDSASGYGGLCFIGSVPLFADGATRYTPLLTSSLGANILTALGVNVGSAGAPVVNGGAGGTPSSLTLTSATGLPAAGVVGTALTKAIGETQCSTFKALAAGTTDSFPLWHFPYAITITSIDTYSSGDNVVGSLDECTGTGGICSGVTTVKADFTTTADTALNTTSLTNGGIAANNWIKWHTTSHTGTNTFLSVCINYTRD